MLINSAGRGLTRGGLAQPQEINSQNVTVHDSSVCVASAVVQVHSLTLPP